MTLPGFCRRGIRKALKKTEAQEEEENEVDLMFADVDIVDESAPSQAPLHYDGLAERFTPVCTPSRNRKDLLGMKIKRTTFLSSSSSLCL